MTKAAVPEDEDYVRISQRKDGRWRWDYHTAGNHEPSGGDRDQGFGSPSAALVAAARVTGYIPEFEGHLIDFGGHVDLVWAVPGRSD